MQTNSTSTSNAKHLAAKPGSAGALPPPPLNVKQRLELTQIGVFAEDGDLARVQQRTTGLLKALKLPAQLPEEQASLLRDLPVEEVLRLACAALVTNAENGAPATL